jgi:hypothetical protein
MGVRRRSADPMRRAQQHMAPPFPDKKKSIANQVGFGRRIGNFLRNSTLYLVNAALARRVYGHYVRISIPLQLIHLCLSRVHVIS